MIFGRLAPPRGGTMLLDIFRRGALYTLVGVLTSTAFAGAATGAYVERRSSPVVVAYYVDAEVSRKVHVRGKTLTIAVPGKTQDWPDSNWAGAFDLAALGHASDAIIVMAYDQHWSTSAPGPVAALPWVEEVAQFAAQEVGPDKVLLGLAFYGYDWPRRGHAVGVSMREAEHRAARSGARIQWDQDAHVPYFKTATRTVYFENARSIEHKLELATRHSLGGVAAWRLGQELPQVWDVVSAYGGPQHTNIPAPP